MHFLLLCRMILLKYGKACIYCSGRLVNCNYKREALQMGHNDCYYTRLAPQKVTMIVTIRALPRHQVITIVTKWKVSAI